MAFGFGNKDKDEGGSQAQQISPEALALLEQMAANGQAQAQPQAQAQAQIAGMDPVIASQPQAMGAPAAPETQYPTTHPTQYPTTHPTPPATPSATPAAMPAAPMVGATAPGIAPGMAPGMAPTMPPPVIEDEADTKGRKKGKRLRKPKLSREEKQKNAKLAKEEKDRNKRRKKLSKSRFSRARYLREANGNAVAGLALWIFMIMVFIAGPFILNTQILMPQTRANIDVVNQISQLTDTITRSQPAIELALRDKSTRENEIKTRSGGFATTETVVASLNAFIDELKANDIQFEENAPANIVPQDIGVTGLVGQTVSMSIRGDFLSYLRIRNKFVRSQNSMRVSEETIQAEPNDPTMSIMVTITIPSKNS